MSRQQAVIDLDFTGRNPRIIADIPWALRAKAKDVPGYRAKWDKTVEPNKFLGWTYPLDMETCWAFRRVFGADLLVSGRLSAWAREELKRRADLEAFRDTNVEKAAEMLDRVRELTPDLYMAISSRPYQMTGTAFLLSGKAELLGDEPGLGKTLQALAALVQSGAREILVVCPRSATRTVWARETNRWAPHIMPFVAQGSRSERDQVCLAFAEMPYDGPKMLIINTEMMRAKRQEVCKEAPDQDPAMCPGKFSGARDHRHDYKAYPDWPWLFDRQWDAIVLDESHNALASTKNIQSKGITQVRFGAVSLRRRLRPGGLVMALSGTPFRSKLERAWGTLNWLAPDKFSSFWRFAETHFEVSDNGWGKVIGTENEHGRKVAIPRDLDAFDRALRPYYLARTKAEAAPDIPPIMYAGTPPAGSPDGMACVWVDMEPKQAAAYREMAKMAEANLSDGRITANGVLAELTRLRQFADAYGQLGHGNTMLPALPSAKIEWVLEFLRELEGTDRKVIIASSFTEVIKLLGRAIVADKDITSEVRLLTGETTDKARAELVARFQDPDDSVRIAIINSRAGGEAITLDRADDVIAVDLPWTSDEWEQVENRAHRVSRIHQVTVYRLASVGTVDEWMAGLTDEQRSLVHSAKPQSIKLLKEAVNV